MVSDEALKAALEAARGGRADARAEHGETEIAEIARRRGYELHRARDILKLGARREKRIAHSTRDWRQLHEVLPRGQEPEREGREQDLKMQYENAWVRDQVDVLLCGVQPGRLQLVGFPSRKEDPADHGWARYKIGKRKNRRGWTVERAAAAIDAEGSRGAALDEAGQALTNMGRTADTDEDDEDDEDEGGEDEDGDSWALRGADMEELRERGLVAGLEALRGNRGPSTEMVFGD
ncbi:hypothetical protein B484DRAFT_408666 [Ochromonadaceae sp. CCMP2298]|nr:hypothetical protein B484DRAFT_408666 [Ochromonadaceae sp. CCMP2298]